MGKIHTTKEGEKIPIEELSYWHLQNILNLIEKKAEEGFYIDVIGDDIVYDMPLYYPEYYRGHKALQYLNYYDYLAEIKRRRDLYGDEKFPEKK